MPRCSGTTAKQSQCKRIVKEGQIFCSWHTSQPLQPRHFAKAYPKPVRIMLAKDDDPPANAEPNICVHNKLWECDCYSDHPDKKQLADLSNGNFDSDDLEEEEDSIGDTDAELEQFHYILRLRNFESENKALQTRVANQRQTINELIQKQQKMMEINAELSRTIVLKELNHEEDLTELNSIIKQLTSDIKKYKRQLTVSEINAECYKELLRCEQFFDILKKIRNKVCPFLADRRFHIEGFMRNKTCVETASRMLNLSPEDITSTYFEYKTTRNKLAHPIFEGDINDTIVNII
jgi:hypothetical protein